MSLDRLKINQRSYYGLQNPEFRNNPENYHHGIEKTFTESQPQNPEFRNNPENFHPGVKRTFTESQPQNLEFRNNPELEDLKVLKHSPDLLNNVKISQGQLRLIIQTYFVLPYMGSGHFDQVNLINIILKCFFLQNTPYEI